MLKVVTMLWDANAESLEFSRCFDESWVMKLYDGVARNLTKPYQFVLFTDRQRELGDRDVLQILIDGLSVGYHSFIEPFRLDDPMILMGLDTIVTGNIDHLAEFCLSSDIMALPVDPYHPTRVCNGVALVPAGQRDVYEQWSGENDMEWLNGQRYKVSDRLFPGHVVSFKACAKNYGLRDARIVYFHGWEKPHEVDVDWVGQHWRAEHSGNGATPPNGFVSSKIQEIVTGVNTSDDVIFQQIDINSARALPWLEPRDAHDRVAVIVGGGPSLKRSIEMLRGHGAAEHTIFALNNTAHFLRDNGVTPNIQFIIDPRPENVAFVKGGPAASFILASQCHPSLFDELDGEPVTVLQLAIEGIYDHIPKTATVVSGTTTAGLYALNAVYTLGYREMHLYGYDSSDAEDGEAHAYPQHETDPEKKRLEVWVAGKRFRSSFAMYKQAEKFQGIAQMLAEAGATIHVHGDGLLPTIAHEMTKGESHGLQAG
jgi:hypothetical protein